MLKSAIKNRNLWLHLSFWCVYLSFNFYQVSVFQRRMDVFDWPKGSALIVTQFLFTLMISYFNYFVLLPRFLAGKKWWRYLLEFIIPFITVIALRVAIQRYIVDGYTHQVQHFYSTTFIVQAVVVTLFIVVFIGFLRFVSDWFEFEATKKEVENQTLVAELNFLRAQVNPHFLFNTLNNLYYLAYSKSPNTTEVISKLSLVMRYMIYEANHPKVLLAKEIEYMENYIALEKLRLSDQAAIHFKVSGEVSAVEIVPLILITFLENAFKHGVSNTSESGWVNVSIDAKGSLLDYTVENSKSSGAGALTVKSGIGLVNVRRRLDLLYPNKYELNVSDEKDRYYIHLKLDLGNV
jgi:two-component system, LytTR family, sensor histidine kinase AlgZ